MQFVVPAVFLVPILGLLSRRLQAHLKQSFSARPWLVFIAASLLCCVFCSIAWTLDALSGRLAALLAAYVLVPAIYGWLAHSRKAPAWADFLLILWLWLPIEFAAGAAWVPKPAQGLLHIAAYGVSVTLGLVVFLLSRRLSGVKYNLPLRGSDARNVAVGFVVLIPTLWILGRAIGFLIPFHFPSLAPARIGISFIVIFLATALPEEILFRGFIQNCLMQKLGRSWRTLVLAAVIFGAAHLDNGPQPLPNWRYFILASIAGAAYGRVFADSSSILASATLHALTDTMKHVCF